jgi:hypothetical protein
MGLSGSYLIHSGEANEEKQQKAAITVATYPPTSRITREADRYLLGLAAESRSSLTARS